MGLARISPICQKFLFDFLVIKIFKDPFIKFDILAIYTIKILNFIVFTILFSISKCIVLIFKKSCIKIYEMHFN